MLTWMIALPVLIGGVAATLALLRRRGRLALRLFLALGAVLLLAALALVVVITTAGPATAETVAAGESVGAQNWAALLGAAIGLMTFLFVYLGALPPIGSNIEVPSGLILPPAATPSPP